jgi:hypothetical protein
MKVRPLCPTPFQVSHPTLKVKAASFPAGSLTVLHHIDNKGKYSEETASLPTAVDLNSKREGTRGTLVRRQMKKKKRENEQLINDTKRVFQPFAFCKIVQSTRPDLS